MEEKESKAVKSISARLTPEVYDLYQETYELINPANANQFIETLLIRYSDPVKVNSENIRKLEENKQFIVELQQKIAENEKNYTGLDNQISERDARILELETENIRLKSDISQLVEKCKLPENCRAIMFEPLNLLLLQYVAERENSEDDAWDIDRVVNYTVSQRFEHANRGLASVSDHVIRKFKKILKGEN